MSDELYSDFILDEVESPYHRGHVDCPTIAHEDKSHQALSTSKGPFPNPTAWLHSKVVGIIAIRLSGVP